MGINAKNGSETTDHHPGSMFLSAANIFTAYLSAFELVGYRWQAHDNHSMPHENVMSDLEFLDNVDPNTYLVAPTTGLMKAEPALGSTARGSALMREYPDNRENRPPCCEEPTTNHREKCCGLADHSPDLTVDETRIRAVDVFNANVVHFARGLNEHLLLAIVDLNGTTTFVNDNFCITLQYSSFEILGQHYRVFNSTHQPDQSLGEAWQTIELGKTWKGELSLQVRDGATHWLEAVVMPCFNRDATIYQYIVMGSDITVRKRTEEALFASRNEMRALANHIEIARESERKRIAREIHDDLGQHLLALKMDVTNLHASTVGSDPTLSVKIQFVLQAIDDTMRRVKSIINDLRPASLELGLTDAVQSHLRAFERRSGIHCELLISDDQIDLDDEKITVLFRVLQESLVNIKRHAQASRASVALYCNGNWVSIEVSDDGKGIAPDCGYKRDSFGLLGMRERIEDLGGIFVIESVTAGGTKIIASIPR